MERLAPGLGILLLLAACGEGEKAPASPVALPQTPPAATRLDADALRAALERAGFEVREMGVWRQTPELALHAVPVKAEEAIDLWTRARAHVDEWGHYPVVVDDTDGEFQGQLEDDEPKPLPTLEKAKDLDPVAWMRARVEEDEEYYGDVEPGVWAPGEPQEGFLLPYDHEGNPRPGLRLVFVPTTRPWEAIAWFQFGGWNACPEPAAHVAMHRRWHEGHGAELVCLGDDVLEMRVERPVRGRDAALALAREHFVYCADLIHQGYGSLRPLATSLVGARNWYFWWD